MGRVVWRARRLDLFGLGVVTAGVVQSQWSMIAGLPLAGMDTATAFYPWYGFLGESLRAGRIPGWNPDQFSGTPFAADPESGWMYLPAMVTFSLFALPIAARAFVVLHVLLAGWFTYALARALGANAVGATLAGLTYALSGFLYGHSACCFAYASVAVWLPLVLLGAERAIRSGDAHGAWLRRAGWWGIGGFGLSQILAAWVGQGAYYACLVLGAYLIYRTLLLPEAAPSGRIARVKDLVVHGAGLLLFGLCLAAAGLLPRLEYNAVSNLPGGYPDPVINSLPSLTDWGFLKDWNVALLTPGFYYVGVSTLVLAVVAPLVAWRRRGVIFFALLALAALVLSRLEPTPLHWLLGFLPGYERLTQRSPERALMVFYLPCALLAGTALTWLSQLETARQPTAAVLDGFDGTARFAPMAKRRRLRYAPPVLAWLLVVAATQFDLYPSTRSLLAQALRGDAAYDLQPVDLARYYAPPPSIQFLQAKAADTLAGFRYFGYAEHFTGVPIPYTLRWAEPRTAALGVNNLALGYGLNDIQGYNPVHVARYDEFMAALNGQDQNYHHTDILESGLNSPLIDLLNVRYVIVPTVTASDELAPRLERGFPVAYADAAVTVYTNPAALARFRLVHTALQVAPGRALEALQSAPDPRAVTVLETTPPELGQPATPGSDVVEPTAYTADDIKVSTLSSAAGLLVSSEVAYPAWNTYVDGRPAQVYVANHAFRAVAVPAGQHVIEFRFESAWLRVGLVVSLVAYGVLVGLLVGRGVTARRKTAARCCRPRSATPRLREATARPTPHSPRSAHVA